MICSDLNADIAILLQGGDDYQAIASLMRELTEKLQ